MDKRNKRASQKAKVEELSSSGLSLAAIGKRAGVPKTTAARWIRRLEPGKDTDTPVAVSAPVPDDGSDPDALDSVDAVDLTSPTFLEAEKRRLYIKLATGGYDRGAAILFASVSKELRELKTCENHYEEEDLRRLCTSLNGLWLRHLEIASRDMAQVGHTDAIRILDKAIEKVRVEAESLT